MILGSQSLAALIIVLFVESFFLPLLLIAKRLTFADFYKTKQSKKQPNKKPPNKKQTTPPNQPKTILKTV